MTGAIHQFVATAEPGAVGTHMLELQRLVREELGVCSEIFTEHRRGLFADRSHDFRDYGGAVPAGTDDILVYQMAIGSVVADHLAGRKELLVLDHHNLTPVRYLRAWDPGATYGVEWGQRQLNAMAGRTALAIGHSQFNVTDLVGAGYGRTAVCPVLFDLDALGAAPDPAHSIKATGGARWLFTGRISAHKCQHLVVRALAAYRRLYDPAAQLCLVGGPTEGSYVDALGKYISDLGLDDAVTLTGPVSHGELVRQYRSADVFVCLSEHEGFCVPLVEAMALGVPVVALGSSAVPETAADAAVVLPFTDTQPAAATVAAAVHRVLSDETLRSHLVRSGLRRAGDFSLPNSRRQMLAALRSLRP